MKSNRYLLFIASSIFCLSLSIGFFTALYVKNSVAGNLFALSFYNENTAFGNKDIEFLTQENYSFTFAARLETEAASETMASQAEIVGTNAGFASINKLKVVSGSFFNDIYEKKLSNVAVLDSAAAWHFFGNINCVGNSIRINGKPYQVIGVFENSFPQDDNKLIYIPYENMKKHKTEGNIFEILIAMDGISYIEPLIKNIGYMPEDIRVLDMEQYKGIMMQRVRIIIFLGGIFFIIYCVKRSLKHARSFVKETKDFFEDNYIFGIRLLIKKKRILLELCLLAVNILLIFPIINIIRFKIYLPYYFFSLSSISYSVLTDLLNFFMQPYISISFLGYMNDLNAVSNLMFFVSVFSGIVVLSRHKFIFDHSLFFTTS